MKRIREYVTDYNAGKFWEETVCDAGKMQDCMHVVNVYPDVTYQTMRGFGGAFTESAAHNYAGMSDARKKEMIQAYFGGGGLRYNLGRLHMGSCDFALGNYAYVEEGDGALSTFSIAHDEKEILPLVKDAQEACGKEMAFMAAPWSCL